MTFSSDLTQMLFHELSTDTQKFYVELEDRLADAGRALQVDAVCAGGETLEVIIRINEKLDV